MKKTIGNYLGWAAFTAGAVWLVLGFFGLLGFSWEGRVFPNVVIPIFGMITAILLIRQK